MSEQRPIKFDEAKELFETYKNDPANKGQTQQVYFKYQELMEYLNSIAGLVDPNEVDKLGIKLYLGQYPQTYTEPEKRGRRTVFFVPCIAVEKDGKIVNKDMLSANEDGEQYRHTEAYNHGTICPPFNAVDQYGNPICGDSDF